MTRSKSAFVRCSPELAKRVKDEAVARDLGERFLVDRALTDLLDNLIPVDEFSLTRKRVLPSAPGDDCDMPECCDDASHTEPCSDCGAWIHRGELWLAHRIEHEEADD